jgi:hypothetical protein
MISRRTLRRIVGGVVADPDLRWWGSGSGSSRACGVASVGVSPVVEAAIPLLPRLPEVFSTGVDNDGQPR